MEVLKKFGQSGLTMTAFCRQEAMSRQKLSEWKRAEAACREYARQGGPDFAQVMLTDERRQGTPCVRQPAAMATAASEPAAQPVMITVDASITVSVPPGTDCQWVGGLLRCLRVV
jgi:hypothetical protein